MRTVNNAQVWARRVLIAILTCRNRPAVGKFPHLYRARADERQGAETTARRRLRERIPAPGLRWFLLGKPTHCPVRAPTNHWLFVPCASRAQEHGKLKLMTWFSLQNTMVLSEIEKKEGLPGCVYWRCVALDAEVRSHSKNASVPSSENSTVPATRTYKPWRKPQARSEAVI